MKIILVLSALALLTASAQAQTNLPPLSSTTIRQVAWTNMSKALATITNGTRATVHVLSDPVARRAVRNPTDADLASTNFTWTSWSSARTWLVPEAEPYKVMIRIQVPQPTNSIGSFPTTARRPALPTPGLVNSVSHWTVPSSNTLRQVFYGVK